MTFKDIRKMSGLSMARFAEEYNININTIKSWEANPESKKYRHCPEYMLPLLYNKVYINTYIEILKEEDFYIIKNSKTGEEIVTDQNPAAILPILNY